MMEARRDSRLVEKHLGELVIVGEVLVHQLDGIEALEPVSSRAAGHVHGAHAAPRDLTEQLIGGECRSTPAPPHRWSFLASSKRSFKAEPHIAPVQTKPPRSLPAAPPVRRPNP